MEWITVITLIIIGIGLIIAEVIFVPGTTLVGILGLISVISGVYLGFDYFGSTIGWWILIGSSIGSIAAIVITFRSRSWEKFSLKNINESRVNENLLVNLEAGDEGITTSVLRPIGKAEIKDREYEVKTFGNYLNSGIKIRIVRFDNNNIYVEPINN